MLLLLLLAGLTSPQTGADAPMIRSVTLGVYTKKAEPVSDLQPGEVVVKEGRRKAAVLGIEPDRRPLEVAVVIDSSAAVAPSYRSDLVAGVVTFWKGLPPDTRVAAWTSGPPSRVVDFGTDVVAAERLLQSVAPAGKNYAFDAFLDACRELGAPAAHRHVLVYVGGAAIEASRTHTVEAMEAVGRAAATPMIVLALGGGGPAAIGGPTSGMSFSWDVQGYFEQMADAYGGSTAALLTTQAAAKALGEAAAALAASYRLRYESTASDSEPPTVEIRRKGVKVLVGRTQVEVARSN